MPRVRSSTDSSASTNQSTSASSSTSGGRILITFMTIELTDEELRLTLAAVKSYLDDFGHDEADVLRRIKELLAKLQASANAAAV